MLLYIHQNWLIPSSMARALPLLIVELKELMQGVHAEKALIPNQKRQTA